MIVRHIYIASLVIDNEFLEQGVIGFLYRESNRVLALRAFLRNNFNLGHAVRTAEIGRYYLIVQSRDGVDTWNGLRVTRKGVGIVTNLRCKTEQRLTSYIDICQVDIIATHARIVNNVCVLGSTLCHDKYMLRRIVLIEDHYRLAFSRRRRYLRKSYTFIDNKDSIFCRLGCILNVKTFNLEICQSHIVICLDGISYGILCLRSILSDYNNTPLAFSQLTKENNFCFIGNLISYLRIRTARL